MASLNARIHPAPSHTLTHFLDSSVSDSVHADHMYGVDDAFFRMDLAHPGPGASPDPQGDCSSYDLRLHLEQALLNDCADAELMSSLMLDDAAAYAYGSPASLLSTPQPEPHSQYAYDQWDSSSLSPPVQSVFDLRQHSFTSVNSWTARDAIPVQSAYSTIADALGPGPADVYAPAPLRASTMAPSLPAEAAEVFGQRQAEPAPESRRRENRLVYQQAAYSSSYRSPTPSSSASSPYSSPSPSSSASSSYPSPSASSSHSSHNPSTKPQVIYTPRRNTAVSPNVRLALPKNSMKCPYCRYVARDRRGPDLRRHVRTHTRSNKDESFKCCGVPLAEAKERGVPEAVMQEKPLVYQKIEMVGGCRKAFSRRDALLRHLRDNEGKCFGDAHAPYLLGNQ